MPQRGESEVGNTIIQLATYYSGGGGGGTEGMSVCHMHYATLGHTDMGRRDNVA